MTTLESVLLFEILLIFGILFTRLNIRKREKTIQELRKVQHHAVDLVRVLQIIAYSEDEGVDSRALARKALESCGGMSGIAFAGHPVVDEGGVT